MKRYLTMIMLACGLGLTSAARAETRVAVHDFYGPQGERLRLDVAELLVKHHGLTVVPHRRVEELGRTLEVDPFSPEGRMRIARELGLSAWLTGVVEVHHHHARLRVVIYDGADHHRMGGANLEARTLKKLRSELKRSFWQLARSAILESLAPLPPGRGPVDTPPQETSVAKREPAVEPPEEQVSSTSTDAAYMKPRGTLPIKSSRSAPTSAAYSEPAQTLTVARLGDRRDGASEQELRRRAPISDGLRLTLGIGTPMRGLRYSDALSEGLTNYSAPASALIDAAAVSYPLQAVTSRWPSRIGLDAAAQGALGGSQRDDAGYTYKSRYNAFRFGVRARLPVGSHFVHAFTGYALLRGSVDTQSDAPRGTPNVDYRALRSGLGAELNVTRGISVGLDAAWWSMLSAGEIGQWFPRATVNGLELALQASYALTQHCFARLASSYRRFAFDFHARPGDERVAGGATDQTLAVTAGMGVSL
jgi:hypothetical protein